MRKILNWLCFGDLLRENLLMGAFVYCVATSIIDFSTCAQSRLATGSRCLCLQKTCHCLRFSFSLSSYFVARFTTYRTTQREWRQTPKTYTAIRCKQLLKKSLLFQTFEKNFAEFPHL